MILSAFLIWLGLMPLALAFLSLTELSIPRRLLLILLWPLVLIAALIQHLGHTA